MKIDIIATGSTGNAVLYDEKILIDCGVSFRAVLPYIDKIKIILISHIHSDHLNVQTIKNINDYFRFKKNKPIILGNDDVYLYCKAHKVDIINHELKSNTTFKSQGYDYVIKAIHLYHDVLNYGYYIERIDTLDNSIWRQFHATDTHTLEGINLPKMDGIALECNYNEEELLIKEQELIASGEYNYLSRVRYTHLSDVKYNEFIHKYLKFGGVATPLHQSRNNL